MSKIPYDNKSHKRARRLAIRAKEMARTIAIRTDHVDVDPAESLRRSTRRAMVAAGFLLAIGLAIGAHGAEARGNNGHAGKHAVSSASSGHSAIASFRAHFAN